MASDAMDNNSDISPGDLYPIINETYRYHPMLKLPTHMVIVYGVVYGLIFLTAVVGNVMVVVVVAKTPKMGTVTNLFIANLAIADILVAIFCIPITFLDNIYYGEYITNSLVVMGFFCV